MCTCIRVCKDGFRAPVLCAQCAHTHTHIYINVPLPTCMHSLIILIQIYLCLCMPVLLLHMQMHEHKPMHPIAAFPFPPAHTSLMHAQGRSRRHL